MTSLIQQDRSQTLRRAAVRATLAPSIHNTQPWRFVLSADALEIHADRSRQLRVLDLRGRQMTISCGCALFNARASMAAAGYDPAVERRPDPMQPSLAGLTTTVYTPGAEYTWRSDSGKVNDLESELPSP